MRLMSFDPSNVTNSIITEIESFIRFQSFSISFNFNRIANAFYICVSNTTKGNAIAKSKEPALVFSIQRTSSQYERREQNN